MSRKVFEHPGILICSGCGTELQSEHGATYPMPTQWIYFCPRPECPQHNERLVIPVRSMVCMTAV